MLQNQQTHIAYCLKCKEKRQMNSVEILEMPNGLKRAKGICPHCSGKLSKILPKNK
jgi:uncharacterized protein with PIN domain